MVEREKNCTKEKGDKLPSSSSYSNTQSQLIRIEKDRRNNYRGTVGCPNDKINVIQAQDEVFILSAIVFMNN